jgi:hypothetical protein
MTIRSRQTARYARGRAGESANGAAGEPNFNADAYFRPLATLIMGRRRCAAISYVGTLHEHGTLRMEANRPNANPLLGLLAAGCRLDGMDKVRA